MHHRDIPALAQRFATEGYLVIPGFLSPDQATALGNQLDARIADGPVLIPGGSKEAGAAYSRERSTVVEVYAATDLPLAQQVFHDSRLMALSTAICGVRWRWAGEPLIFSTPVAEGRQGWHQDTSDPRAAHFFCNRICFPRTVAREQGALYVVPGSQNLGDIPPGGDHEPLPGEVEILPSAGTVVILHSRCFHRVGANRGSRPRIQVNLRVRPEAAEAGLARRPRFRTGVWDFATASAG